MINIIKFLEQNNIPYVLEGPNVAKGNVYVKCPFCGSQDPSEHLGINIANGHWGCWRSPGHAGRKLHRLVMSLLRCSYRDACYVLNDSQPGVDNFDDFATYFDQKEIDEITDEKQSDLEMPVFFRKISLVKTFSVPFHQYLQKRGFGKTAYKKLSYKYKLKICIVGNWKNRIIFPVYLDGVLVTWTGRTIDPTEKIRYKTLTTDTDKATQAGDVVAIETTSNCLYLCDIWSMEGKTLYICEGPFDALKVDYYANTWGSRATAIFGSRLSESQIGKLTQLSNYFDRFVILPDKKAEVNAMRQKSQLSHLSIPVNVEWLPSNIDDPGELSSREIAVMAKNL